MTIILRKWENPIDVKLKNETGKNCLGFASGTKNSGRITTALANLAHDNNLQPDRCLRDAHMRTDWLQKVVSAIKTQLQADHVPDDRISILFNKSEVTSPEYNRNKYFHVMSALGLKIDATGHEFHFMREFEGPEWWGKTSAIADATVEKGTVGGDKSTGQTLVYNGSEYVILGTFYIRQIYKDPV